MTMPRRHFDNEIALGALGLTMMIAVFQPIPPASHDVVLGIATGMLGYLAKAAVDAAQRLLQPPGDTKP